MFKVESRGESATLMYERAMFGAGRGTQVVEPLPKHTQRSRFSSQHYINTMWLYKCYPRPPEVEAGDSGV